METSKASQIFNDMNWARVFSFIWKTKWQLCLLKMAKSCHILNMWGQMFTTNMHKKCSSPICREKFLSFLFYKIENPSVSLWNILLVFKENLVLYLQPIKFNLFRKGMLKKNMETFVIAPKVCIEVSWFNTNLSNFCRRV